MQVNERERFYPTDITHEAKRIENLPVDNQNKGIKDKKQIK